jgi:uncharacterized tellurite resistance protein B-like protein
MSQAVSDGSPRKKTIYPVSTGFDIKRLRCAGEAALQFAIEKDEAFYKRLMDRSQQRAHALSDGRLSLIKGTYRVNPTITPKLAELKDALQKTLRLVQPIDMYVQSSAEPNAFCLPSRKGTRLVMCLHSALLDLLTPHELMFVMGHEVGHALLEHAKIPQIDFDDYEFSPLEVIRTRALGRRQEISCDRVGLLACQDTKVAGSALLKIMSGLSDRWLTFDETVFAKQFDEIAELAEVTPMDDAVSTHPIIALRVKALLSFADSHLYAEALGLPAGKLVNDEMERTTQHLLSVLEPDLSELESASEEKSADSLLINGALAIVASDGILDRDEIAYLNERLRLTEELVSEMKGPDFVERALARVAKDAVVLSRKLSVASRAGLLRELCRVALAVGGYAEGEQHVLIQIGQLLEIPGVVFRDVMGSISAPEKRATEVADSKPKKRRKKPQTAGNASDSVADAAMPTAEEPA